MKEDNQVIRPLAGDGVLVEFFPVGEAEPVASVIAPQLSVHESLLPQLGLAVSSPLALKVSGKIAFPITGEITFRFHDVRGDLRMTIDGITVLESYNTPVQSTVLETDAISVSSVETTHDFIIISQGVLTTAAFTATIGLKGSIKELEIPQSRLFPNRFHHPVCSPTPVVSFVGCDTTFEEFRFLKSFKEKQIPSMTVVYCDGSCYSKTPPNNSVRGSQSCYHMESSICYSAIEAEIMPPVGGLVRISSGSGSRGQFGERSFLGMNTSLGSASDECGWIDLLENKGNAYILSDLDSIEMNKVEDRFSADFVSTSSSNARISSSRFLLSQKWAYTKRTFTDVELDCTGTERDDSSFVEVPVGSTAKLWLTNGIMRQVVKYPILGEVFIADEELTSSEVEVEDSMIVGVQNDLINPRGGWNRLVCATSDNTQLAIYAKFYSEPPESDFPSLEISCVDTFDDLFRSLGKRISIVVRCPPDCMSLADESKIFVSGLFVYTPDSTICHSAIHAGVATKKGGVVKITKAFSVLSVNANVTRNDVSSAAVGYSTLVNGRPPNYWVDVPRGAYCSYPYNLGLESATSVDWKDELPNGALVTDASSTITSSSFRQFQSTSGFEPSFRQSRPSGSIHTAPLVSTESKCIPALQQLVQNAELSFQDQQSKVESLRTKFLENDETLKILQTKMTQYKHSLPTQLEICRQTTSPQNEARQF
eukprot:Gregarina_sp_Poly_1__9418@NODE_58_length_17191_cov_34_446508_g49_i0_p1_GENE_NODE_58_length_17191_cov_34_446508_g49_i0NODE_58_length_17191_cov_34_446508_g49_i0_p1_ORF_typecomplete_len810_score119_62LCCL/PF03815_19/1_6e07LCCL/PF03815_19/4_9e14PA14/PF07691_12/0_06FliT/PF05400_13/0_42_NODE_58_length_17191_cov_34_446508_g49_i03082431